jgi:Domain of unknown function (DUF4755)
MKINLCILFVYGLLVAYGSIESKYIELLTYGLVFFLIYRFFKRLPESPPDPWLLAREGCQFKHFYKGTGIALDATSRVIYLKDKKLEKPYPFNDIREWKYNISTGGQVIGGGMPGAGHIIGTAIRNERESGFFVEVRDIDCPKWRIAFPYNGKMETELLRWMEIFRQYVKNE